MIKLFMILNFILFLNSCSQKVSTSNPYRALECLDREKKFTEKYIFNKNTGFLYIDHPNKNSFKLNSTEINNRSYKNLSNEYSSKIIRNRLIIKNILYTKNTKKGYKLIKHIINLNTLEKRTIFKDKNGSYMSFKVSCKWIDPLVGIK